MPSRLAPEPLQKVIMIAQRLKWLLAAGKSDCKYVSSMFSGNVEVTRNVCKASIVNRASIGNYGWLVSIMGSWCQLWVVGVNYGWLVSIIGG